MLAGSPNPDFMKTFYLCLKRMKTWAPAYTGDHSLTKWLIVASTVSRWKRGSGCESHGLLVSPEGHRSLCPPGETISQHSSWIRTQTHSHQQWHPVSNTGQQPLSNPCFNFFFSYSEFLNLLNTFHCPDEFTAEHITVLYITQLLVHNGEAFTTVQWRTVYNDIHLQFNHRQRENEC